MTTPLHIAVAFGDLTSSQPFAQIVRDLGHFVVTMTPDELAREFPAAPPELLILDAARFDALEAVKWNSPCRAIVVGDTFVAIEKQITKLDVFGCLSWQSAIECLRPAISAACQRSHEHEQLQCEIQRLRQSIEERKLIERAKGVLMRQDSIDEESAFLRLQAAARNQSVKMVDIARVVLATRV
jgi:response regulator NasT